MQTPARAQPLMFAATINLFGCDYLVWRAVRFGKMGNYFVFISYCEELLLYLWKNFIKKSQLIKFI